MAALDFPSSPTLNQTYTANGNTWLWDGTSWVTANQMVTSVALSLPSIFSVTGSPITSAGTLTAALVNQSANTVFAGPDGSTGVPTFRALTANDIPSLTLEKLPDAWVKRSVKAATTANITLSGTQTIDGIALVAGDRVLVKNQTTASQNGIYVVSASAWSRAADASTAAQLAAAVVGVDSGTTNGGLTFDCDLKSTDTLGTTSVSFSRVVDQGYMTTVGNSFATLTNPGAITFPQINADNTVSALTAANFRTAISAQQTLTSGSNIRTVNGSTLLGSTNLSVGTVTSVAVSNSNGLTISGSPITGTGTISIGIASGGVGAAELDGAQTGSAPIYAARAWVNFNGTGTVAIRASGNVSSITDGGVGNYTVNFTTAMSDANYASAIGGAYLDPAVARHTGQTSVSAQTTTSCLVRTNDNSSTALDHPIVCVTIFR